MNSQFQNIGIVIRPNTPDIHHAVNALLNYLLEENLTVILDHSGIQDFEQMPHFADCEVVDKEDLGKRCHVVMVLGGDGTFLSVARIIAPYRTPLIGINLGRLGFLTQVPHSTMVEDIAQMLTGKYLPEDRILLETTIVRDGADLDLPHLALNDVVVSRGGTGQMIEFEVFINKEFVYTQRSDGLIISTPTGSTAYSLAAGGPILQSTLRALTLVPICPQSMTNRPIAISDACEIEILITRGMDACLHFDGQSFIELQNMDRIIIHRYRNPLRVLHPTDYQYYKTLRNKLHWGEQLV